MPSKLGAYLKTKEATGTTGYTDQPNPNPDLNLNSNLDAYVKDQQPTDGQCMVRFTIELV